MTRPAGFHFLHGGALNGLLCNALQGHPLPEGVVPFACESGRVRFEAGERYNIGVTLVGEARGLLDDLAAGLHRIGATEPDRTRPLPALCGNFEVVEVTTLPAPDLEQEATVLAGSGGTVTLQFLAPLRMERPRAQKLPGEGYLNASFFPVPHFLLRLWGRLFRLAERRPASEADRDALRPSLPAGAATRHPRLFWVDLPVPGEGAANGSHGGGLRLGGVMGSIGLTGISPVWVPPLVLGQYLHAGEHVHFGLGRYRIAELATAGDPFRPARSLLDRLTDPTLLRGALQHVVCHSTAAGQGGGAPERVRDLAAPLVERLAQDLASGTYRPGALRGRLVPEDGGKVRPLAIPTVRDRAAQRAVCELLSPAIDTLLEDTPFAYRKGHSRAGAASAIRCAHDEGFRVVLDADIASFFDAVDWDRIFIKLEALFPREPLIPLLEAWVTAPVVFGGRVIARTHGLPQGAGVSSLLANLFLDEFEEKPP